MGQPKALLDRAGEPLVRYVVRQFLVAGVTAVRVVVRPESAAIVAAVNDLPRTRVVVNPDPARGMLSSVQSALVNVPENAALLVCPCDLPLLQADAIRSVLHCQSERSDRIVVPLWRATRGHPTLFGPALVAAIRELDLLEGGLNRLLRDHADAVVTVSVTDDGPVRDTDTPEEWNALRERF